MSKVLRNTFSVHKVLVTVRGFNQEVTNSIVEICNKNIRQIVDLWELDSSRTKSIEIFKVSNVIESFLYFSSTIIGVVALFIFLVILVFLGIGFFRGAILSLALTCFVLFCLSFGYKNVAGLTLPGYTGIKILVNEKIKPSHLEREETVIHELCHALSYYLVLLKSFLNEGLAQVTSEAQTGRLPILIQRDNGEYFHAHEEYIKKREDNNVYVYSYWMVRYLTRDLPNRKILLSILRKGILPFPRNLLAQFIKPYNTEVAEKFEIKGVILKTLNEFTYQYFRERNVDQNIPN